MRLRVRVCFVFGFFLVILLNRTTLGICLRWVLARTLPQEGIIRRGDHNEFPHLPRLFVKTPATS